MKLWKEIKAWIDFLKNDIWSIKLTSLPRERSLVLRTLRIIILSIRGFDEDKCQLRASALTFYSLISIVPVAAMAFGIAKGFGFDKILEKQLREQLVGHEEIFEKVITFSHSLLESTRGGLLAGIGIIILFWAVIKVLGQIEDSFNDIWGIKEHRSMGRRFSDYLSLMLIGPVIIILSSSVNVFISTQLTTITEKFELLGYISPVLSCLFKILPYCLVWGFFTFLYIFMPNTRVRFTSGLLAGIAAGTAFQIVQWVYITFQIGAARYNAIYGSFAALPLFLVWLQLSWLIMLIGAELSFAHQNVDTYEFEPDSLKVSPHLKLLLTLQITHLIVKNFAGGKPPRTAGELSHELEIPIRLVNEIIFDLEQAHILSGTNRDDNREPAYQPALDISTLSIHAVSSALQHRGIETIPFAQTREFTALSETLRSFSETIEKSPSNLLLKDL